MRSTPGPMSLRRRIAWLTGAHTVLILLAIGLVLMVNQRSGRTLAEATDAFVEEHRIADRLGQAVLRQITAAIVYPTRRHATVQAEYEAAAEEAYRHIREYLFRDLDLEQRLQLERMKEEHQRLEVAAARVFGVAARGQEDQIEPAIMELTARALVMQGAIDRFLSMREAELDALRARQDSTLGTTYLAGVLFGALVLVWSLIVGHFVHRRVTTPLAELAGAARRIGEGDLAARVPTEQDAELATVATSFNQMADSLARAKSELVRRNEQLETAVHQLHDTRGELIRSEKLAATGRMMAGLAHELNNPLASVVGFSELLAERAAGGGGGEPDDDLIGPLRAEALRARDLVRNLLHFARRSSAELVPVPLGAALDVVVGLRRYAFQQAGLTLLVEGGMDAVVLADEQRLQQTFLNLVNNAYDAMLPAGRGTLRIRGERRGRGPGEAHDRVLVFFEDEGPGIQDPDRLFEPFFTTKPVGEGTGLGLSLVHRFMEEFGGTVRAGSGSGGGASFVLEFRGVRGTPEPPAPAAPMEASSREPGPRGRSADLRILVVDDEPALRALQEKILQRLGATVLLANGGDEARLLLRHDTAIDLVISDIKMPDGDGLALYRWVVDARPALAARFLFVSGDLGDVDGDGDPGFDRPPPVLHKPFDVDAYLLAVRKALS